MAHNHILSNQQSLTMNPGVSSASTQQHSVLSQRGQSLVPPKTAYQMQSVPMSQMSHMQQQQPQQPQLVNSYHSHRQLSPDLASAHQYSPAVSSLPTQNGNYQTLTGSSRITNLGFDNSQLRVQHQTSQHHQYQQQAPIQPPNQSPVQQQQHYQPQQTVSHAQQQTQPSQQQQHLLQSVQQKHHHFLQQQQQNQQQLQIQQQQQQQVTQQQSYQQQHLQIQQQLQQRSLHQHQRYQKLQSKQVLQHQVPTPKSVTTLVQQLTLSDAPQQESTKPAIIANGHPVKVEDKKDCVKVEDKSERDQSDAGKNNISEKLCLANTKEKTPMCLINELARFNKISHQYTLVDEQGPAHKKTFYVKLKLADEEYSSSGESIKKAQHAAAAIALQQSKFPHPPPKPVRVSSCNVMDNGDDHITPTVELNALAMKRGETAIYKAIEPQQTPYYPAPGMEYRGLCRYNQYMRNRDPHYYGSGVLWPLRCHYSRMSRAFYVSLRVGHREFIGDGPTRQAARHNAAQKAIRILKSLPVQNNVKKEEEHQEEEINDSLKSEISLVHEIALHRNMPVSFEVIREAGPPHMKNFVTKCIVADKMTEGEGNSKKSSKKKAAELMLEELRRLPPVPAPALPKPPKTKIQINKKKNRNLIKSELQQQKADPSYGVGINPISRLIQIMQAQKKKEPIYTLVAEKGLPRRREFVMQVEVENKSCTGTGPNKKLAKRSAAESMLQILGFIKPSPQPAKSSFKHPTAAENIQNGDKKVTFVEGNDPTDSADNSEPSSEAGQPKVPGLLLIPNNNNTTKSAALSFGATSSNSAFKTKESLVNLDNILKPNLRPEIQLRKLCKTLGYEIEVDDFTKKHLEGTEHIARITIGQEQPMNFHGSSSSVESSRDVAALDALKILLAKVKDVHPGGDGPHVKKEQVFATSPVLKKNISK